MLLVTCKYISITYKMKPAMRNPVVAGINATLSSNSLGTETVRMEQLDLALKLNRNEQWV